MKLSERIVDIIDEYRPQTVTIETLRMELDLRFGIMPHKDSINRAVRRLRDAGEIGGVYELFDDYDNPKGFHGVAYSRRRRLVLSAGPR